MDVESVADELYGLRPDEFTRTRTERAKEARSRGDRDVAAAIGRLRKPSIAAWVVNLLVRRERDAIQQLLDLGEQLRQAQGEMRGEDLRALSQRRSQVVASVAGRGRRHAEEAGHPVSETVGREVEDTLEAALADPDVAASVGTGRLTSALAYSGLGPVGNATPAGESRPAGEPSSERDGAQAGETRGAGERAAEEAREAVLRAEQAHARAREDEEDARSRTEEAQARVGELEQELVRARHAAEQAGRDLEAAARQAEDAAGAVATARVILDTTIDSD